MGNVNAVLKLQAYLTVLWKGALNSGEVSKNAVYWPFVFFNGFSMLLDLAIHIVRLCGFIYAHIFNDDADFLAVKPFTQWTEWSTP